MGDKPDRGNSCRQQLCANKFKTKSNQLLYVSPLRAEISCPATHPLPYREPCAWRKRREHCGEGGGSRRDALSKSWRSDNDASSPTGVCGNMGKQDMFCLKEDFDIHTARVLGDWIGVLSNRGNLNDLPLERLYVYTFSDKTFSNSTRNFQNFTLFLIFFKP